MISQPTLLSDFRATAADAVAAGRCPAAPERRAMPLSRRVGKQLVRWYERLRMRQQLAERDERLLRDIGLSQLDAKREINKPFWRE